ncbi:MAG TPA: ATP-binding cassette domain-containing protein [Acidimicrobiia bacterium]|nr:ATP-binding cassette domain-containing protein [Acidimicrobiia bacterium]
MTVLEGRDLSVAYGGVQAVVDLSVRIEPGRITALLGPNGAGKTSVLRAMSGLVPHGGTVSVDGLVVSDPAVLRSVGVIHVPQGRGLFRRLTVGQNLALGAYGRPSAEVRTALADVETRFPQLARWKARPVGSLSGGEQVIVALGRLLVGRPRFALLDEISLGLAPVAVDRVYDEVLRLRDSGVGVLLVEQYAARALAVADEIVALQRGTVAWSGPPAELGGAEQFMKDYLGARR